ncbi:MAG: HAD family hydrolase [Proteobacteria bacterium]|nr:HAD family hydrolase [Pseudomonadota bacterium]
MTCPCSVPGRATAPPAPGAAALFLDRDGVINFDSGYTHRREDFRFMPGIFELAREACRRGLRVVVITNQAGIGRGRYDEPAFLALTDWMLDRFLAEGVAIDRVYYCPHHPEASVPGYRVACPCRKPAPGMLTAAARDLGLDLPASMLVGDKAGDVEAGAAAGVGTLVLLGDDAMPAAARGARRGADLAAVRQLLFGA